MSTVSCLANRDAMSKQAVADYQSCALSVALGVVLNATAIGASLKR